MNSYISLDEGRGGVEIFETLEKKRSFKVEVVKPNDGGAFTIEEFQKIVNWWSDETFYGSLNKRKNRWSICLIGDDLKYGLRFISFKKEDVSFSVYFSQITKNSFEVIVSSTFEGCVPICERTETSSEEGAIKQAMWYLEEKTPFKEIMRNI